MLTCNSVFGLPLCSNYILKVLNHQLKYETVFSCSCAVCCAQSMVHPSTSFLIRYFRVESDDPDINIVDNDVDILNVSFSEIELGMYKKRYIYISIEYEQSSKYVHVIWTKRWICPWDTNEAEDMSMGYERSGKYVHGMWTKRWICLWNMNGGVDMSMEYERMCGIGFCYSARQPLFLCRNSIFVLKNALFVVVLVTFLVYTWFYTSSNSLQLWLI